MSVNDEKLAEWRREIESYQMGGLMLAAPTVQYRHRLLTGIAELLVEVDRLRAELARALDALRDLYDEQNGPPLEHPRHKASWQAAMDKANKLLEASNG